MNSTTSDKIFKVTSQGNLRVLIDPFVVMTTSGVFRYGGGFVDCADNSNGFVVVDGSTGEPSVTSDPLDLTKVYLCSVQASQGVARVIDQYENGPWVAADYGGGGGNEPTIIAPYPGIGAEGDFYSGQVLTTGATPQTFTLESGTLPVGTSLGAATGLITGTVAYPNGGLYEFTIGVSNTFGSTQHDFSVLIDGTAPTFGWDWTESASVYSAGIFVGTSTFVDDSTDAPFSANPNSVVGSSPVVFTGTTLPTRLAVTSGTGELVPTFTQADISTLGVFNVVGTNYFGAHTTPMVLHVSGDVIWGEWTGAAPGTFTAADITTTLSDDFGEAPSGPRRLSLGGYTWSIGPTFPRFLPTFRFPVLGSPKVRVLAIPQGWFEGSANSVVTDLFPDPPFGPVQAPWAMNWNVYSIGGGPSNSTFSPAWPTPYQTGLLIEGLLYDIYVTSAITDSPVGTSTGGYFYLSPEGTPIP